MRRHVHSGNHAAESFVSFIPLFDGSWILAWPSERTLEERVRVPKRRQAKQELDDHDENRDYRKEDSLVEPERHAGTTSPPRMQGSNRKPSQ
jgi:hypothetical protein